MLHSANNGSIVLMSQNATKESEDRIMFDLERFLDMIARHRYTKTKLAKTLGIREWW